MHNDQVDKKKTGITFTIKKKYAGLVRNYKCFRPLMEPLFFLVTPPMLLLLMFYLLLFPPGPYRQEAILTPDECDQFTLGLITDSSAGPLEISGNGTMSSMGGPNIRLKHQTGLWNLDLVDLELVFKTFDDRIIALLQNKGIRITKTWHAQNHTVFHYETESFRGAASLRLLTEKHSNSNDYYNRNYGDYYTFELNINEFMHPGTY